MENELVYMQLKLPLTNISLTFEWDKRTKAEKQAAKTDKMRHEIGDDTQFIIAVLKLLSHNHFVIFTRGPETNFVQCINNGGLITLDFPITKDNSDAFTKARLLTLFAEYKIPPEVFIFNRRSLWPPTRYVTFTDGNVDFYDAYMRQNYAKTAALILDCLKIRPHIGEGMLKFEYDAMNESWWDRLG